MITDDFFRSELEKIFRCRKMLKKERNEKIGNLLQVDSLKRNAILDYEEGITNNFIKNLADSKRVPTEHSDQVKLIPWFKCTYPGVRIAAIPNGGNRNERVAAALKLEGVSRGIPDIFIPEWLCWVEMKRVKGGKLSKEQEGWRDYIVAIGQHYILAYGFEDAKNKLQSLKVKFII